MFGYVSVNYEELSDQEKARFGSVYCGVCRRIREQSSQAARLALSYDMAFLALLLMSLYEPEEEGGPNACALHPIKKRPWVDNIYIQYAADMNVALAYYNCMDDWEDDRHYGAKAAAGLLRGSLEAIEARYPRQCRAIADCIRQLRALEKANTANPDAPAGCFGDLMAELLVYHEDMWAEHLRQMGHSLGRYIYLADAAVDFRSDKRKGKYNPYLAMGGQEDWQAWEQYLVLAMGRCTQSYEKLPLVQDKHLLDNILYSGVWVELRRRQREQKAPGGQK